MEEDSKGSKQVYIRKKDDPPTRDTGQTEVSTKKADKRESLLLRIGSPRRSRAESLLKGKKNKPKEDYTGASNSTELYAKNVVQEEETMEATPSAIGSADLDEPMITAPQGGAKTEQAGVESALTKEPNLLTESQKRWQMTEETGATSAAEAKDTESPKEPGQAGEQDKTGKGLSDGAGRGNAEETVGPQKSDVREEGEARSNGVDGSGQNEKMASKEATGLKLNGEDITAGKVPDGGNDTEGKVPKGEDREGGNVQEVVDIPGERMLDDQDTAAEKVPTGEDITGGNSLDGKDNTGEMVPEGEDNTGRKVPEGEDNADGKVPEGEDNTGRKAPEGEDNANGKVPEGKDSQGGKVPEGEDNAVTKEPDVQDIAGGKVMSEEEYKHILNEKPSDRLKQEEQGDPKGSVSSKRNLQLPIMLERSKPSENFIGTDRKSMVRPGIFILKEKEESYDVKFAIPEKILAYNVGAKVSGRFSTLTAEVEGSLKGSKKSDDRAKTSVFTTQTGSTKQSKIDSLRGSVRDMATNTETAPQPGDVDYYRQYFDPQTVPWPSSSPGYYSSLGYNTNNSPPWNDPNNPRNNSSQKK